MRLIDADKFECFGYDRRGNEFDSLTEAFDQGVLFVLEKIDEAPTIEAQEVRHGKWTTKRTLYHDGEMYCSLCDYESEAKHKYCPSCGAKMEDEV